MSDIARVERQLHLASRILKEAKRLDRMALVVPAELRPEVKAARDELIRAADELAADAKDAIDLMGWSGT